MPAASTQQKMKTRAADRAAVLLATWFGCGYSPVAPGTAGALAAVVIAALLAPIVPTVAWIGVVAVLLWPSIWAASRTAVVVGKKDPGIVVLDEVLGQWLTFSGAAVLDWKTLLAGFLLFRLFDIWKPPPVRQLESLPGGAGIIADDLMAGVYGAVVLLVWRLV